MRWLQYLRVRNSKYIQFKGLDNSRLHVAGRDSQQDDDTPNPQGSQVASVQICTGATVARRGLHPAGSIFQVAVGRSAKESVVHHIHIVDG